MRNLVQNSVIQDNTLGIKSEKVLNSHYNRKQRRNGVFVVKCKGMFAKMKPDKKFSFEVLDDCHKFSFDNALKVCDLLILDGKKPTVFMLTKVKKELKIY